MALSSCLFCLITSITEGCNAMWLIGTAIDKGIELGWWVVVGKGAGVGVGHVALKLCCMIPLVFVHVCALVCVYVCVCVCVRMCVCSTVRCLTLCFVSNSDTLS